jgi:hypothetical protein
MLLALGVSPERHKGLDAEHPLWRLFVFLGTSCLEDALLLTSSIQEPFSGVVL